MIKAIGTFKKLDLTANETPLTTLVDGKMSFELGGRTFTVTRKGFFGPVTELWLDKTLVASAKQAVLVNSYAMTEAGHEWQFKAINLTGTKFGLFREEKQVGSISRVQLGLNVDSIIDLPDELPTEVQVFLMWIVLWKWSGDANSSS
jgi:hypothetical protein